MGRGLFAGDDFGVGEGDESLLVERAEGALEGFLAHSESGAYVVGGGIVSEGEPVAGCGLQLLEQLVGKVAETAFADALDGEVKLAVGAHLHDGGGEHVAGMGGLLLEDLVVVELSGAAVVGNDLESEGRFLLHDGFHFLSAVVVERGGGLEVALHLGRGHDALRFLVDVDVYEVGASLLHGHLLLAEGHEEVLHQSPVEKGSELVDPCHTEEGEVAHAGEGRFECADEPFALVEVDEHVDFRAGAHLAADVGFGHEDFADGSSVEVGSVVGEARDAQGVVVAEFDHDGWWCSGVGITVLSVFRGWPRVRRPGGWCGR